jgi:hypothetical protein
VKCSGGNCKPEPKPDSDKPKTAQADAKPGKPDVKSDPKPATKK